MHAYSLLRKGQARVRVFLVLPVTQQRVFHARCSFLEFFRLLVRVDFGCCLLGWTLIRARVTLAGQCPFCCYPSLADSLQYTPSTVVREIQLVCVQNVVIQPFY